MHIGGHYLGPYIGFNDGRRGMLSRGLIGQFFILANFICICTHSFQTRRAVLPTFHNRHLSLNGSDKDNFQGYQQKDGNPLVAKQPGSLPTNINREAIASFMLRNAFLGVIVSVMAMPPAIPSITVDPAMVDEGGKILSKFIIASTLATMVGKLTLGPHTDRIGGEKTLTFLMIGILSMLVLATKAQSVHALGCAWTILSFCYAGTWGAVSKVVRNRFSETRRGSELGLIAAGSRLGSLVSSIVFGRLLSRGDVKWRTVFGAAGAFQAITLLSFVLAGQKLGGIDEPLPDKCLEDEIETKKEPDESVSECLRRSFLLRPFLMMLTARGLMTSVGQFITFIPLYLTTGLMMSPSDAAMWSGVFALGALLSSALGSKKYAILSQKRQRILILGLNIFNALLPGLLMLNATRAIQLPLSLALLILGSWGASWALPFYVPPGIMALDIGGAEHSALITNVFDAVGFFGAAIFSGYAIRLGRSGQWAGLMAFMAISGLVSVFTMFDAMKPRDEKL